MVATSQDQSRLRELLQAGIALTSELSIDALLTKVVEAAAAVTGARYAALGVLDPTHTALERFIAVGLDEETRARIGDLPRGRGILGVLIRDATPLRLRDLMEDPRAVGFPPGHPPMHSFLGVPVLLRGTAYGNLYLTEKEGGEEFTDEDEELVTLLAAQAAVAIENARLYETSTRWLRQRETLDRIADELVSEIELPKLLELVADALREQIDARIVTIWLPAPDGLRLEAVAGPWPVEIAEMRVSAEDSKIARVFARGHGERADALLDDPETDQQTARRLGLKSGLWIPLLVRGRPVGIIAAYDRRGADPRFSDGDRRAAETLAARAAVAVDLRQRLSRETVRTMLHGQERERRRISRELHDETGQALTSILLALKPLETEYGSEAVAPVRELVREALANVRRLAVELRPAVLDDFGLVPALERLAHAVREKGAIEVHVQSRLTEDERLPHELETALYRITQEALNNVLEHARAGRAHIRLLQGDGLVTLIVEDDGQGFSEAAIPQNRLGLIGVRERVELLAGRLTVEATPGVGVRLVVELPVAERHETVGPRG